MHQHQNQILRCACSAFAMLSLVSALPAAAQEEDIEPVPQIDLADTVFSGDYLTVGLGAGVGPSYSGSDDYVVNVLPIVQASLGGVQIEPRAAGLGVDFIPDGEGNFGFDLGVAGRLRSDRATQIDDNVVESLGELDRAIEIGPTAGFSISQVLNPYDSVSFSGDVLWDVNGAHDGMVVSPTVTYFTPLNRGMAASLTLGTEWADSEFHDYYYRVTPAQSLVTNGELPAYEPHGSGFTNVGATLLVAVDLNGDLTDGGFGLVAIAGYSRLLGDARQTPFTSVRGSADQFLGAVGVGYTF